MGEGTQRAAESATTPVRPIEWCRQCRDEDKPAEPAVFILWGKLFPPEALGPKCFDHAYNWLGHNGISRIDQYAVLDLRPLVRSDENVLLRRVAGAARAVRAAMDARAPVADLLGAVVQLSVALDALDGQ